MSRSLHSRRKRLTPETPAGDTHGGPIMPPETETEASTETEDAGPNPETTSESEASTEKEDAGPDPETTSETSRVELDALRAMLGLHERAPKKTGPGAAPPGVDET